MDKRYDKMSDNELRDLAKQKVKKTGLYKEFAIEAQHELWKRRHWETDDKVLNDVIDRDIVDVQYNGYYEE